MPTSSEVTAGNNARASEYNNLRTDAIARERVFTFIIKGTLVTGDEQGPKYIIPENATVSKIEHIIKSGTSATFRIQQDTSDVDASIAATTTKASETSITDATLDAGKVLSLDITGVSGSPVDLIVQVYATYTLA